MWRESQPRSGTARSTGWSHDAKKDEANCRQFASVDVDCARRIRSLQGFTMAESVMRQTRAECVSLASQRRDVRAALMDIDEFLKLACIAFVFELVQVGI